MTTRAGRAVLAAAATAVGLLAAWFIPSLAVPLAWPLLLLVPGWVLIGSVRPRIDAAGRIGLGVVLSVAISTHLVFWLSHLAGGYARGVVFAALAIVATTVPLAAWQGRLSAGRLPRAGAVVVALAGMAVVGVTLGVGLWRTTATGISSGGSNWSDLGVHLSIAETLNAGGNFPPQVPYFAGVPLVYHWFADFHAAILAQAAGLFSVPAMVVQSTVLTGALALLVFSLARRLVRDRGAVRAAAIAAALAVFAGGLGWTLFIRDVATGAGTPLDLIANHSYDNQWLTDWPYFRIPSVMGTGLLVHRATTAGLPMLVGAVLLLIAGLPSAARRAAGWRDNRWCIGLAGLLGALLAPFHFFFFPVVPLLALAWVITAGRLRDADAPRNAATFLAPYALALPFVVAPALQAGGSGALRLVALWPSAPTEGGVTGVVFFYLTNLGVPFVLAMFALLARGAPTPRFLAAWIIGLFVIPNVIVLSAVDFDMNKYFQAMWIAVAVAAAWLIRHWPRPAVAAVFALSVGSPLLVAGWTATSNLQVISTADVAAGAWVRANTPPGAVFVTNGWVNSLTDSAGRKRLTTFGPYIANLGYHPDQRIGDVTTIFCGGDPEQSARLMRQYGAQYLIDDGPPQPCVAPVDFGASGAFELVHDLPPLIWRLADP